MMWYERLWQILSRGLALLFALVGLAALVDGYQSFAHLNELALLAMDDSRGLYNSSLISVSAIVLPLWRLVVSLAVVVAMLKVVPLLWRLGSLRSGDDVCD